MPTISIKISGGPEIEAKLNRLGNGLLDMTQAMREIGDNFLGFYSNQPFISQGGIYGMDWAPLALATMRQKKKHYPTTATQILVRTGDLKKGFKVESGKTFMRLFNDVAYFQYHQLGTKNLPQRVILALTKSRFDAVKSIIEADVRRKIDAA